MAFRSELTAFCMRCLFTSGVVLSLLYIRHRCGGVRMARERSERVRTIRSSRSVTPHRIRCYYSVSHSRTFAWSQCVCVCAAFFGRSNNLQSTHRILSHSLNKRATEGCPMPKCATHRDRVTKCTLKSNDLNETIRFFASLIPFQ